MRLRWPALIPLCLLAPGVALAEPPIRDGLWRGTAGASVALSSGNTESAAVLLNLNLERHTQRRKTTLQAFANHGQSKVADNRNTTAAKWSSTVQQDQDVGERWFAFGKLGLEGDRLLELKRRSSVAAGMGYHLVETDDHTVDLFGGLMYTHTVYRRPQTIHGDTGYRFASTGLLLGEETSHKLTDSVTLKQRLEYMPGVTDDETRLVKLTGSVDVSITKRLSLTVGLRSQYTSRVPPGVHRTDTSLFTGINTRLGR